MFTYRCGRHNRDQGCTCFLEKYYLGYVLLEQLSIATDIQFHVFKFVCHGYLQKKLIVHIQCLLRVDGSLVAGVFLTSFFCVVPESPYSSDAASSSLLVA